MKGKCVMKDNINDTSNLFNPYLESTSNSNDNIKVNQHSQNIGGCKKKDWNDGYIQSKLCESNNSNFEHMVNRKPHKKINENTADQNWKDSYSQNPEKQKIVSASDVPQKMEKINNPDTKNVPLYKGNPVSNNHGSQQPVGNNNVPLRKAFNMQNVNNMHNSSFQNQPNVKHKPICDNYFISEQNSENTVKTPQLDTNKNNNVINNNRNYQNSNNTAKNMCNSPQNNPYEKNINNTGNCYQNNTTIPNDRINYNCSQSVYSNEKHTVNSSYNQNYNTNQSRTNFPNMGNQPDIVSVNKGYVIPNFRSLEKVYDKVDRMFAIFSIVLGFLFIFLIGSVFFNFGIGATIFFIAALLTTYFYLYKKEIKIDTLHNVTFVSMILLSLPFTIYSNRLALGIDFTVLIFGLLYWIYSADGKTRNHLGGVFTELMISWFANPFMNFTSVFTAIFKKDKSKKQGNAKWIILGLIIALPIVCIVSSLLLMGDEMFNAMFSFIFENFISKIFKYLWYAILGLPIAMGIFSSWYTKHYENKKRILSANSNTKNNTNYINCRVAPIPLMYSIAIPLCVVYFLYLISQIAYFVSFIADNLLPEGFTIVDYARSGFFELCVVTVINIVVIALLIILTKRPANIIPMGLRIITTLMSVFTMVIISTALYKMFMYIGGYGYTSMRINTSIFMIFLLIVFVLIIAKQLFVNVKFFTTTMVIAFVFLAGYNLLDVDAFIAKENIRRFQQGEISWMGNSMIAKLDDSAFEYIVPFAADENNGLSGSENDDLDTYVRARYRRFNDDEFSTFNISSYKVHSIMKKYGYDAPKKDDYYNTYNDYDNI